MKQDDFSFKEFLFCAFHYKWTTFVPLKKHRCFGPYNVGWYDGPHYGFGLWFFNINFG